jgi:predicted  nucleic acid-binding Zn-ribbon protein
MADALDSLREFNKLLRETNAVVKEKTTALESRDEELGALDEEEVSRLNDALEDFDKGAAEAHTGVLESLDELRDAATNVRDTDLAEAAQEVERYRTTLEQQLETDDSSLERAYGEVSQAFDALEAAAGETEADQGRLQQEATQAFTDLETALGEAQQQVDSAGDTAANAIDALAGALEGEDTTALDSAAEGALAQWAGLPDALDGDCNAGAQALNSLYESAKSQLTASGDELITATDVLDEAVQALEPAATELATQVDALTDVLGDVRLEGQALEGVLRPGAETAEELLPLLADLAVGVSKAAQIREALDAIEAS